MPSRILRCQVRVDLPPSGCKLLTQPCSWFSSAAQYACGRSSKVVIAGMGRCNSLLCCTTRASKNTVNPVLTLGPSAWGWLVMLR